MLHFCLARDAAANLEPAIPSLALAAGPMKLHEEKGSAAASRLASTQGASSSSALSVSASPAVRLFDLPLLLHRHPYLLNPSLHSQYYSTSALFGASLDAKTQANATKIFERKSASPQGSPAQREFALPDIKPLPSIVAVPASAHVVGSATRAEATSEPKKAPALSKSL